MGGVFFYSRSSGTRATIIEIVRSDCLMVVIVLGGREWLFAVAEVIGGELLRSARWLDCWHWQRMAGVGLA